MNDRKRVVQGFNFKVGELDTVRVKHPTLKGQTMLINKGDYDSKIHGRVILEDEEDEGEEAEVAEAKASEEAPAPKKTVRRSTRATSNK